MKTDFRYRNIENAKPKQSRYPVLFVDKSECCGCGLCYNECLEKSIGAISMVSDEEGFLYPQVDLAKCIGCGRCMRKCPLKKDSDR